MSVLSTSPARAEPASTEQADALFQRGLELLDAEKFEEACLALEESLALERAIGTLLNLGRCYEATRRPASAFVLYEAAAHDAEKTADPRARLARQRADAVDRKAPRALLGFPHGDAPPRVAIDGRLLDSELAHEVLRLDPGEHTLEVQSPKGASSLRSRFRISEDNTKLPVTIAVPVPLDEEPAATEQEGGAAAQALRQKTHLSPTTTRPERDPREDLGRTFAWVGVGLGVSTMSAGFAIGAVALSNAAAADCVDLECSEAGLREQERAKSQLDFAYGIAISGGVVAAGSAILLLLAFPDAHTSPPLKPTAHVDLRGFQLGMSYRF